MTRPPPLTRPAPRPAGLARWPAEGEVPTASTNLDAGTFGCLGVGAPYAVAATLAFPDRQVIAVTGDGAFGLNAMEDDSALRHGAKAVFIVSNNADWNIERFDQEFNYRGRVVGTTLRHSDYAAMAQIATVDMFPVCYEPSPHCLATDAAKSVLSSAGEVLAACAKFLFVLMHRPAVSVGKCFLVHSRKQPTRDVPKFPGLPLSMRPLISRSMRMISATQ